MGTDESGGGSDGELKIDGFTTTDQGVTWRATDAAVPPEPTVPALVIGGPPADVVLDRDGGTELRMPGRGYGLRVETTHPVLVDGVRMQPGEALNTRARGATVVLTATVKDQRARVSAYVRS